MVSIVAEIWHKMQGTMESRPDPVIEAYKKDVDRTLIRENLSLPVEERFRRLMKLQEFAEELRRAMRERRAGRD
jgi:hypothetical protein